MIELNKDDYPKIKDLLNILDMNVLFAKSVALNNVNGTIYVDNPTSPSTIYVKHPYGMSLLVGETDNRQFNEALGKYLLNQGEKRKTAEWLQVYPLSWNKRIEMLLGLSLEKMPKGKGYSRKSINILQGKVQQCERINFVFNKDLFLKKIQEKKVSLEFEIKDINEKVFNDFGLHVVPRYFWNNAANFFSRSIGYTLLIDQKPISIAFASFLVDDQLEIGIETAEQYRGRGYASLICSFLIKYCLAKGYLPVWSCHAANLGSIKLAARLGFQTGKVFPYYHLI